MTEQIPGFLLEEAERYLMRSMHRNTSDHAIIDLARECLYPLYLDLIEVTARIAESTKHEVSAEYQTADWLAGTCAAADAIRKAAK